MMETARKQRSQKQQRRSFFELLTEVLGWLQIVASPLLVGLVVGFLVYLATPDTIGIVLGLAIAIIGLVVGVSWATRIWKKKGTVHFISKVIATPELDRKVEEQDNSTQQQLSKIRDEE